MKFHRGPRKLSLLKIASGSPMKRIAATLCLTLAACHAIAQESSPKMDVKTGNDFLRAHDKLLALEKSNITNGEFYQVLYMTVLLQSYKDLNQLIAGVHKQTGHDRNFLACIPAEVETGQVGFVIKKALEADPSNNHRPIVALAQVALVKAYPCK